MGGIVGNDEADEEAQAEAETKSAEEERKENGELGEAVIDGDGRKDDNELDRKRGEEKKAVVGEWRSKRRRRQGK